MLRILVVSDTHIPIVAQKIPYLLLREAKKSDFCLHAGDLVEYNVFSEFSKVTKTYAVCGNMDNEQVRKSLPEKLVVALGDVKIGLIHGVGNPDKVIDRISDVFTEKDALDMVVFGHSHIAFDKVIKGIRYFNPGSPTDEVFCAYKSYGILEVQGREIRSKIVKIG